MKPSARGAVAACMAALILLFVISFALYAPDEEAMKQTPSLTAERVLERMRTLESTTPRTSGSASIAAMRDQLLKAFAGLGLTARQQSGFVCNKNGWCGTPVNILARLPATAPGADSADVVVSAHYDSMPASSGAADNLGNVAIVLEIARELRAVPERRKSVIFLLTDMEETGLLGAELFVQSDLSKNVGALVNLEARGTSGPSLMFETGSAGSDAARLFREHAPHPHTSSLYAAVYSLLPNITDFTVFKAAGIQGFNLAFIGDPGLYHSDKERIEALSTGAIQSQADNAFALVRALAQSSLPVNPDRQVTYFDLFGFTVVVIPQALVFLLAIAAFIEGMRLLIQRHVRGGLALKWTLTGFAVFVLAPLVALVLGAGALFAIDALAEQGLPMFSAYPALMRLAFLLLGIAVAAAAARGMRTLSLETVLHGYLAFLLLVAVALTLAVGVVNTYPVLFVLIGVILLLEKPLTPHRGKPWALALLCLLAAAPIVSLLPPLEPALGSIAWPVIASLLAIASMPAIVAASRVEGAWPKRAAYASGFGFALGCAAIALLPAYTPTNPQTLNVRKLQHLDPSGAAAARWLVLAGSHSVAKRLPEGFLAQEPSTLPPPLSFGGQPVFEAPAPLEEVPDVSFIVNSRTQLPDTDRVRYVMEISAPQPVNRRRIAFDARAEVDAVEVRNAEGAARQVSLPLRHSGVAELVIEQPGGPTWITFESSLEEISVTCLDLVYGLALPPELATLRGVNDTPRHDGDLAMYSRTAVIHRHGNEKGEYALSPKSHADLSSPGL